jgi:protein SCO1/2
MFGPRTPIILTFGAAALAALALAAVSLLASNPSPKARAAGLTGPAVGTALREPRATPALGLIDEQGKPTSIAAYHGRWLVLAPSMTLCHEVCPMTTSVLSQLDRQLARAGLASKVAVAEVTVDPWRDTPYRLRAYKRLTGADFALLTGTPAQISNVWRFFGVYYKRVPQGKPPDIDWLTHKPETFDVQHSDDVFIVDPSGRERIVDEGMPEVSGTLSPALRGLLDQEGRQDLAHPQLPWTAQQVYEDLRWLMHTDAGAA